ncbi:MAG: 1,4-dihydroxy-2-naphthoate polyprenyltransferase [Thermonemataceae bacterium]|nr:1,4-dihydroxy-2-naphthoate polyprenyltransferase [Thermonemataceae bacterium]
MKHWLKAFRLRTLPLALSSVGMGAVLAFSYQKFNSLIFGLSVLTTIFLQILSNLANDYGDAQSGVDNSEREGPSRAVQTGLISAKTMKKAIILFVLLSFLSGLGLLYVSFAQSEHLILYFLTFLGLGVLAIIAAITYTIGKKPYGYIGLGDISVMAFFGWVGVLGSFFLYTRFLEISLILPATACGLLSVAVLNVNNIRDIESDKKAGKNSIPVRLGRNKAVAYHYVILGMVYVFTSVYAFLSHWEWFQYIFLLSTPLFIKNAKAVTNLRGIALDPYLKQMALSALIFIILFGLGIGLKS